MKTQWICVLCFAKFTCCMLFKMRISLVRFLRLSRMSLRLLCAPVSCNDACLITLCEAKHILTPVIASDGRIYDAMALQNWLQMHSKLATHPHVVPGCPINHVDVALWPHAVAACLCNCVRLLWHRGSASGHRMIRVATTYIRKRVADGRVRVLDTQPRGQVWKRVISYHRRCKNTSSTFRGGKRRFTHHPASPFAVVQRAS